MANDLEGIEHIIGCESFAIVPKNILAKVENGLIAVKLPTLG
jgi:hypothetical protein